MIIIKYWVGYYFWLDICNYCELYYLIYLFPFIKYKNIFPPKKIDIVDDIFMLIKNMSSLDYEPIVLVICSSKKAIVSMRSLSANTWTFIHNKNTMVIPLDILNKQKEIAAKNALKAIASKYNLRLSY